MHRTLTERCDFVVHSCQHAKWTEERSLSIAPVMGDPAGSGRGSTNKVGVGAVPKHYQPRVQLALASIAYTELKRSVLQRLSNVGASADLDALQMAATEVTWDVTNFPKPFQWAPLLVLLAEGPERGLQAELVDNELAMLADISQMAWQELLRRAAALQLTVDKVNLPENLMGLELPEVLATTSSRDFSGLRLAQSGAAGA